MPGERGKGSDRDGVSIRQASRTTGIRFGIVRRYVGKA